ncbi:hypothetical protein H1R20_g9850, partial [Candolleomyces eurysporus]
MDSPQDPTSTMLETKMTVWPKTVKEIDQLLKHTESHAKDLTIDLAAAEMNTIDGNTVAELRRKYETVLENTQALRQLLESHKKDSLYCPELGQALASPHLPKSQKNTFFRHQESTQAFSPG